MISNVSLQQLLKAQAIFERFRKNITTDQDQAGAVQSFEFCFELAWKAMKKIIVSRGITVASPKETFRYAALENLIARPEPWFTFLELRNLTVHTYEENNLNRIVEQFDFFSKEFDIFIKTLHTLT